MRKHHVGLVLGALALTTLGLLWSATSTPLPTPAPLAESVAPAVVPVESKSDDLLARAKLARAQSQAKPQPFVGLPLDQPQPVEFTLDESTSSRLTKREQRDQLLDWLLFTVVSQAGLSADQVNRVLYDVPTVRHGHMRAVANFEYGATRSCCLGQGQIVALVPKCAEAQRKDHLAHVADEHRKNLGDKPRVVLVFEYELKPQPMLGTLTRRADLQGDELFTEAYGYREQHVGNLREFESFLASVQDVTYVRLEGSRLVLGGRSLLSRKYRGLRVEDVAAVWQAQTKLKKDRAEILARLESAEQQFKDRWERKQETANGELKSRWQSRLDALNLAYRNGLRLPDVALPKDDPAKEDDPLGRFGKTDDEIIRRAMRRDPWDLNRGRVGSPRDQPIHGDSDIAKIPPACELRIQAGGQR